MTIWELKTLGEQKIKDERLTEQQRNAWQNALNGAKEAIKLYDDIFYGRINICHKCRRKDRNCTNAECLAECEKMVKRERRETEQISLF